MNQIKIAVRATIVLTILTGLAYPLLVTGLAQAFFHRQSMAVWSRITESPLAPN